MIIMSKQIIKTKTKHDHLAHQHYEEASTERITQPQMNKNNNTKGTNNKQNSQTNEHDSNNTTIVNDHAKKNKHE